MRTRIRKGTRIVLKAINDCNLPFKTRSFFVHFRKLLIPDLTPTVSINVLHFKCRFRPLYQSPSPGRKFIFALGEVFVYAYTRNRHHFCVFSCPPLSITDIQRSVAVQQSRRVHDSSEDHHPPAQRLLILSFALCVLVVYRVRRRKSLQEV
jgi:hypothetical protein